MANKELIKHKILDSKVLDHEDIFFGKTKILKDKLVISIKNSPFKFLRLVIKVALSKVSAIQFKKLLLYKMR